MAKLKAATHAWLLSSIRAEPVLRSGAADSSDPQAAQLPRMAPVEVYQTMSDTCTVVLGDIRLNAYETPGHTPGALNWQWESFEDRKRGVTGKRVTGRVDLGGRR